MNSKLIGLFLLLSSIILAGCASLSEDECQVADWRTIGYEDGSKGELKSRIGAHREACAKYAVQVDFDEYNQGHDQGVITYCTANRGFNIGKSGRSYNGVCPANIEADFLSGFNQGRDIYLLRKKISDFENQIANKREELKTNNALVSTYEQELIAAETTPTRRLELLIIIKDTESTSGALEAEIEQLQSDIIENEIYLNQLLEG